MDQVHLEKKIPLNCKYITSDIKRSLLKKTMETFSNNCSLEDGYIINIYPNIEIIDNNIYSSTESVIFNVKLTVDRLKPLIGMCVDSIIIRVMCSGILCETHNVMKIFIPSSSITNNEWDEDTQSFDKLQTGSTIPIEITKIRYENRNFNCIGVLKDNAL